MMSMGSGTKQLMFYSLTSYGAQRAQSGAKISADPITRRIFSALVKMGGSGELQEVIAATNVDPATIQVSLSKLNNMGLISAQTQQVQTLGSVGNPILMSGSQAPSLPQLPSGVN
jgi:predicted transcriptional regulator